MMKFKIYELKKLSKILKVSVDELIENNLQNIILSKINITEKQTIPIN